MQNSSKLCRLWTSLDQLQFIKYGIKHRSPSWCFVACCPGGINGNLRRVGPCLWHALVRICADMYVHICGWKGTCVLRVLCVCAPLFYHTLHVHGRPNLDPFPWLRKLGPAFLEPRNPIWPTHPITAPEQTAFRQDQRKPRIAVYSTGLGVCPIGGMWTSSEHLTSRFQRRH